MPVRLVRPGNRLGQGVDVMGRDGEPLRPRRVPVHDELAYLEALARVVPEAKEREVPVCRLMPIRFPSTCSLFLPYL